MMAFAQRCPDWVVAELATNDEPRDFPPFTPQIEGRSCIERHEPDERIIAEDGGDDQPLDELETQEPAQSEAADRSGEDVGHVSSDFGDAAGRDER